MHVIYWASWGSTEVEVPGPIASVSSTGVFLVLIPGLFE